MRIAWLSAALLSISILLLREVTLLPDGQLHLHVFDVGQGDAMLLVSPTGKQIVVDGGPDTALLEHLGTHMPFFDRTIELLILSHPDADHVTALPDVLRRYHVENMLMTGAKHRSGRYDALLAALEESDTQVLLADPSLDINFGDGVVLDVVWPSVAVFGTEPKNANDQSVVVRVLYGDHSILLSGDIEEEAEMSILASGADIRADVLKVPHHGSRTSSSTGFILAVHPQLALISAGRNNRFGHPHQEIVDRYQRLGIVIRSTSSGGTASLVLK